MESITLTVNGSPHTISVEPERPLLEVLREELGLTGTKYGCGEARCRACTVFVNEKATLSCVTDVGSVAGAQITTIEGLSKEGQLHAVQEAFLKEEAFQCGFCTPGFVMQTVALLRSKPAPTDEEIIEALNGSLCRCCNYPSILRAVQRAAGRVAG